MPRCLMLFIFFLIGAETVAQVVASDMVVLRNKQGHTIKSYFSGMPIDFGDLSGREVSGIVRKIEHDTLYIQQYDIRRAYNQWGTYVMDTVTAYLLKYNVNEITWIRKPRKGFEFVRDGTIFIIGGTAYLLLHVFNAAYLHEPVVASTVAIAGGIALGGVVMKKLRKNKYMIGKKYKMVYIPML
jgi:hypothetical protein